VQELLAASINQIDAVESQIVLVLDDYHLITSPQIHKALTYLLDHLPRNLHLVIATRAMDAGMVLLKPRLAESGVEPVGKVALGTVKGDLHNIGKNLVEMMMEGAGFEVMDLGLPARHSTRFWIWARSVVS
jgi:hypothetical protein